MTKSEFRRTEIRRKSEAQNPKTVRFWNDFRISMFTKSPAGICPQSTPTTRKSALDVGFGLVTSPPASRFQSGVGVRPDPLELCLRTPSQQAPPIRQVGDLRATVMPKNLGALQRTLNWPDLPEKSSGNNGLGSLLESALANEIGCFAQATAHWKNIYARGSIVNSQCSTLF